MNTNINTNMNREQITEYFTNLTRKQKLKYFKEILPIEYKSQLKQFIQFFKYIDDDDKLSVVLSLQLSQQYRIDYDTDYLEWKKTQYPRIMNLMMKIINTDGIILVYMIYAITKEN